ncbi:MAG: VCBS repeat-containing protein [Deltaproteobacteria bacterium]|nr:VCBS repeat-containing protein [Deltaproteobacteria bacterium]
MKKILFIFLFSFYAFDQLSNIVESAGVGCAFIDYDQDGDLDIYLVNGSYKKSVNHPQGRRFDGKLSNALFRNDGDGSFSEVTKAAGVGDSGYGMAVLFADYDNDGDPDLYLTNYGNNTLYKNNGDGTFTDVTKAAGVECELWSVGCTFLDFDNDGWLDLYVGNYLAYDPDYQNYYAGDGFPGPLAYPGQPDVLYRNKKDGTFEDVTKKAGVFNPQGRAMGVASCDFNDDGFMDIFVANDAMENYMYRNNKDGTFTNIAFLAGTGFGQNGEATSAMSPEFGDFDLNGKMDILIPDMGYSSLFLHTGPESYTEISSTSGLAAICGQYTSW